ncbi:hypothetical protein D9M69_639710 [compost metagenome]
MADDRGDLIVVQLQLVDQPAVEEDLAARTAAGIQLGALDQVDLPLPLRGIGAENRRLLDQAIGNHPQTLGIGTALVQHTLARRLAQRLLIGRRIHLIDLLAREHAGHVLLALDTYRATTGGVHGLASCQQQGRGQRGKGQRLVHAESPLNMQRMLGPPPRASNRR